MSNSRLLLPNVKADSIPAADGYECRSVVVLKLAGAQVRLIVACKKRATHRTEATLNIIHITISYFLERWCWPRIAYCAGHNCYPSYVVFRVYANWIYLVLANPAWVARRRPHSYWTTNASLVSFSLCIHILGKCSLLHHTIFNSGKLTRCSISSSSNSTSHSMLNTLKMCNWILHLDDSSKTMKSISKSMRNSPLCHVKVDGITVMDRPKKTRIEPQFVHMILMSLPNLRWLGISLGGKKDEQITAIGNAVLDIRGHEIDIR